MWLPCGFHVVATREPAFLGSIASSSAAAQSVSSGVSVISDFGLLGPLLRSRDFSTLQFTKGSSLSSSALVWSSLTCPYFQPSSPPTYSFLLLTPGSVPRCYNGLVRANSDRSEPLGRCASTSPTLFSSSSAVHALSALATRRPSPLTLDITS